MLLMVLSLNLILYPPAELLLGILRDSWCIFEMVPRCMGAKVSFPLWAEVAEGCCQQMICPSRLHRQKPVFVGLFLQCVKPAEGADNNFFQTT